MAYMYRPMKELVMRDAQFAVDEDGVEYQVSSALDERGREIPDPVPMAPPVGYKQGPTLRDMIESMINGKLAMQAMEAGFESFEEAEDFDVDDDFDPRTPYEDEFGELPPDVVAAYKAGLEGRRLETPIKPGEAGGDEAPPEAPAASAPPAPPEKRAPEGAPEETKPVKARRAR